MPTGEQTRVAAKNISSSKPQIKSGNPGTWVALVADTVDIGVVANIVNFDKEVDLLEAVFTAEIAQQDLRHRCGVVRAGVLFGGIDKLSNDGETVFCPAKICPRPVFWT